jgi:hypothetical protein
MRILILGDGNCSFGKALETRLESSYLVYDILNITTLDSQYPETRSILNHFQKNPKIQINHSVDATKSLLYLSNLQDQAQEAQRGVQQQEVRYDYIIFNFPHIGIENSQIHSSMVAHILYQVKEVLNENGVFYLSLADEQPTHWRLYDCTTFPLFSFL